MHNSHVSVESLVYYCPHGPARWSHPLSVPRLCLSRSLPLSPLLSVFSSPLSSSLYSILSLLLLFRIYLLIFSYLLCVFLYLFSIFFFVFNSLISHPLLSQRVASSCCESDRLPRPVPFSHTLSSSSNNSTILICLSLIYHSCLILLLLLSPAWRTRCPYLPILHSARKRLGSLSPNHCDFQPIPAPVFRLAELFVVDLYALPPTLRPQRVLLLLSCCVALLSWISPPPDRKSPCQPLISLRPFVSFQPAGYITFSVFRSYFIPPRGCDFALPLRSFSSLPHSVFPVSLSWADTDRKNRNHFDLVFSGPDSLPTVHSNFKLVFTVAYTTPDAFHPLLVAGRLVTTLPAEENRYTRTLGSRIDTGRMMTVV